ncbi:MAG: YgiQ family radical SAM protein [Syntrophorhabdaceae bacterium]|nr:YgiQ family radical SAM protein [Syntrophorhabdaceae bacterium]MDD4196682.1 YgiQ family radical SAM protein [Syntrophorhabdaceae bacterium]
MPAKFLPMTAYEVRRLGWNELDVILISGDAYVDHPSYGAAVIGRVLEADGFKVGIIAQPDFKNAQAFKRLGRPRLFFGITAGNMDSMVANYTAHKRRRMTDDYSPGGMPDLRPDHAAVVYANRAREAFKDVPIVLGGIEASLRRFAHYDWWRDEVKRSILLDGRANILVYGMGETQIIDIAHRIAAGKPLSGIPGTALITKSLDNEQSVVEIPSYEDVRADPDRFNEAFVTILENQDPFRGAVIAQKHANRYVIQYPPALPVEGTQLDKIYELPYARAWHPSYDKEGGVPGFETVRYSITSHRGCPGSCSFCGLSLHQGRIVGSRSESSIIREAAALSKRHDFHGIIHDIGGPTANLYGASCKKWEQSGTCTKRHCLTPSPCKHLDPGFQKSRSLYRKLLALPGIKHVFIESGFRHDLLVDERSRAYLEVVCKQHVSGRMKVAPEHSVPHVLKLMNKADFFVYEKFSNLYRSMSKRLGKEQFLVNYFISAHPGCDLEDTLALALQLKELGIHPEQIQDFIPLPMTLSGAMYYTEKNPFTGDKLHVAKTFRERKMHRALIQYKNPKNTPLVREALKLLKKEYLIPQFMPGKR